MNKHQRYPGDAPGVPSLPPHFMNAVQANLLEEHNQPPAVAERCPWYDGAISRSRFAEIEAKIRKQEETKLAEAGKQLRAALEVQHVAALEQQRQLVTQQVEAALTIRLKELVVQRQKELADQRSAVELNRDQSILKSPSGL